MMLSTNQEDAEYPLVKRPEHIQQVWAKIEAALPHYWDGFVERSAAARPAAKLAERFGSGPAGPPAVASVLAPVLAAAVEEYETAARKYRDFFDDESMEEAADDPGEFKSALAKEVNIFSSTLNQRRPELQKWQRDFRGSRPKELLAILTNMLDFRTDWADAHVEAAYAGHDDPVDFALDPLDDDENLRLANVVGMGIKSIILYHLDASRFPKRGREDLYGLYFLSGKEHFGLPSRTSEFLMINDREPAPNGSFIMEHNFWYPYGVFSVYAMRLFRWMDRRMRDAGAGLDPAVRHVFVQRFLHDVCSRHVEDMKVMRAHDRFEVPT